MDGRGWGLGIIVVYERGKIMIDISDNSGGVVVGALVCQTECSHWRKKQGGLGGL